MTKIIRIGTQDTPLALAQAEHVAGLLNASSFTTKVIPIAKSDPAEFLKEVESLLTSAAIDIAVHDAKNLPADTTDELELIGFTLRDYPNDVLLSFNKGLKMVQGSPVVATSSARKIAFLKHFYPNVKTISIPGDLKKQIDSMKEGKCDALIIPHADASLLEVDDLIIEKIETSYFVPSVGQGSLAIECHQKLDFLKKEAVEKYVNDPEAEDSIRAERAFLKALPVAGNIPVFGFAQIEDGQLTLKAGLVSPDGKNVVKVKKTATIADAKELGKAVAIEVLATGGKEILDQLK